MLQQLRKGRFTMEQTLRFHTHTYRVALKPGFQACLNFPQAASLSSSSLPQIVVYFEKLKACKKKKLKEKHLFIFGLDSSMVTCCIFRLWLNHSKISCSYPDTSPSDFNMYSITILLPVAVLITQSCPTL